MLIWPILEERVAAEEPCAKMLIINQELFLWRIPNELTLIQEFLEGKKVHQGVPGDGIGETPLKSHLPRLRELLGLQAVAKPEEKKP